MVLNEEQAKKLLTGNYTFSMWSLSMLITRLKGVYTGNPSETVLGSCVGELNAFMKKFAKIMGSDYAIIEQL